jgi:hypothetical protein
MRKVWGCLAVAALAIGSTAARADTASDAQHLGEIFCELGKDGGQFGRMYLVTRSLTAAINDAQKKSDDIAAAKPNDKPPLGDGVPYQSHPDQAPACKPGKLTDKGREQVLEISYVFPDGEGNWTDRLVLIVEDGRLRIDDVWFGTKDPAAGLRNALVEAFKHP